MKQFLLLIVGVGIELLFLVAYLKTTAIFPFLFGVPVFGFLFLAFLVGLLTAAIKNFGKLSGFYLSVKLAFLFVLLYQVLAFSIYRGLAKDIDAFSYEHILQVLVFTIISLVAHLIAYLITYWFASRVSRQG